MYYHECIVCGCSLDPGEGRICDECKEEQNKEAPEQLELNQGKA